MGGAESLVRWAGYEPVGDGAAVLSALLRLATEPLAARALLVAMAGRIRAERILVPSYGHGIADSWQSPADTRADLVAECFAAISRHAGQDRDDVARLVMQEATRRLRTARQVHHRYQQRTTPLGPAHGGRAATDLVGSRTTAEWLAVIRPTPSAARGMPPRPGFCTPPGSRACRPARWAASPGWPPGRSTMPWLKPRAPCGHERLEARRAWPCPAPPSAAPGVPRVGRRLRRGRRWGGIAGALSAAIFGHGWAWPPVDRLVPAVRGRCWSRAILNRVGRPSKRIF